MSGGRFSALNALSSIGPLSSTAPRMTPTSAADAAAKMRFAAAAFPLSFWFDGSRNITTPAG